MRLVYVFIPFFLIIFTTGFLKKKESNTDSNNLNKCEFEPSIIDFLRNDFKPSVLGVKATILLLFEKEMLFIKKETVNLGAPWAPDEQEIIRLSLTNNINPDSLSRTEDFIIRWLIFTYGDGVYTNVSKVLSDLNDAQFISANNEMYEGWKLTVLKTAFSLGLYKNKALEYGLTQSEYYKVVQRQNIPDIPSILMSYGISDVKKEEVKTLLSVFDQSL